MQIKHQRWLRHSQWASSTTWDGVLSDNSCESQRRYVAAAASSSRQSGQPDAVSSASTLATAGDQEDCSVGKLRLPSAPRASRFLIESAGLAMDARSGGA